MATSRDYQQYIRDLQDWGYTVTVTGGSHFRITHPEMAGPVFASLSPSDWRAIRNLKAILRRARTPGSRSRGTGSSSLRNGRRR